MSTTSSRSAAAKEAAAAAAPTTAPSTAPAAKVVPTENPEAYDEKRLWRDPPWGDTYYCEQCSTCMRWRYSQRIGGRVCVTSFNFNFPMVIIEHQRCNEYRPVPGAEALWVDEYVEEEDEYARDVDRDRIRRDPDAVMMDDGGDPSRRLPRRRPRRRPRRTGPGGAPAGPPV
jgi:hypothetical protein